VLREEAIERRYRALGSAVVRADPSLQSEVVGRLRAGELLLATRLAWVVAEPSLLPPEAQPPGSSAAAAPESEPGQRQEDGAAAGDGAGRGPALVRVRCQRGWVSEQSRAGKRLLEPWPPLADAAAAVGAPTSRTPVQPGGAAPSAAAAVAAIPGGSPGKEQGLYHAWNEKSAEFEQIAAHVKTTLDPAAVAASGHPPRCYIVSLRPGGAPIQTIQPDAADPHSLCVRCPEGAGRGGVDHIYLRDPGDPGQELEVPVPPAIAPGATFDVDVGHLSDDEGEGEGEGEGVPGQAGGATTLAPQPEPEPAPTPEPSAPAAPTPVYQISLSQAGGAAPFQTTSQGEVVGGEGGAMTLVVSCPLGARAGCPLYVTTPEGEMLVLELPAGLSAGQQFEVDVGSLSDEEEQEAL
jgi:hypothetical protein